jgi:hypothetical protein
MEREPEHAELGKRHDRNEREDGGAAAGRR